MNKELRSPVRQRDWKIPPVILCFIYMSGLALTAPPNIPLDLKSTALYIRALFSKGDKPQIYIGK